MFGATISALIAEAKKVRKFSNAELARLVGVSRMAVSDWVTDKADPTPEKLKRIAEVFGIEVGQLYPPEKELSEDARLLLLLVTTFSTLPKAQKAKVLEYCEDQAKLVACVSRTGGG